jgi:TolB protein
MNDSRSRPLCRRTGALSSTRLSGVVWLLIAVACLSFAACGGGSDPILFTSDRQDDLEVYVIDPETGVEQALTNSLPDEHAPMLSPGGSMAAFLSGSEGSMALEVMQVDGDGRRRLGQPAARIDSYRWSPDGRRIAYVSQNDGDSFLYVIDADGGAPMLLTAVPVDHVGGWSPRGDDVVFAVSSLGNRGIWVRNPDGVNELRLTDQDDYQPVWSPDAKRIAFLSRRDGNPELYVMRADGSEQTRLTNTTEPEYQVSWSPKGRRILFVSERDGNPEIYVTDVRGDNVVRLTTNNVRDDEPVWSPNGRRIAFVSYLDGDADIFTMDADGDNQLRLTSNDFEDTGPSW